MDSRLEGAWIISHANKLSQVDGHDFDDIDMAGKAGKLLSGLVASDEESTLNKEKVVVIAKVAGLSKGELPTILNLLKDEQLIDVSKKGEVVALGITTSSVLDHTSNVFNELEPSSLQKATITLAEGVSAEPLSEKKLKELIADTHKLSASETADLFQQAEEIGLVDAETVDDEKLFFNGNLFKSDTLKKARKVLDTLNSAERTALQNIDDEIAKTGVITYEKAEKIAGKVFLEKMHSIGLFEFNRVSNDSDTKLFITKPESFSKFGNPFVEDALDLAKALVSSLSYGMIYSRSTRGRIDGVHWILNALLEGRSVGPATAIGQDYRYLETKRVVEIIPDGRLFRMRLLKKEIGELALQVMKRGDASDSVLLSNSSNVSIYDGPEKTRSETRRKRTVKKTDAQIANSLRTLRTQ